MFTEWLGENIFPLLWWCKLIKRIKLVRILAFILLVSFSKSTLADFHCTGKIRHIGSDGTTLHVSNGYGVHRICRIEEDGCKLWASFVTAAKMADHEVRLYYRSSSISGNQNSGQCLEIGSWVSVIGSIYYVEVL